MKIVLDFLHLKNKIPFLNINNMHANCQIILKLLPRENVTLKSTAVTLIELNVCYTN